MGTIKKQQFSPSHIIVVSLLLTIFIGSLLLALPIARNQPVNYLDLLFTATSATCVAGLFSVPFTAFTFFGKTIILALMQIGSIGLVTMMFFIISLFINLGLGTQLVAGQILELESWTNIRTLLIFIIIFTVSIELLGVLLLYYPLHAYAQPNEQLFYACFYSISSFCNAGISPDGHALLPNDPIILLITTGLMLTGGLGFVTWFELAEYIRKKYYGKRHSFSLHSKIVLYATTLLMLISAVIIWILEREHNFSTLSFISTGINSLFLAVASKSTGFITFPIHTFQPATLFLFLILSFIGSAPGSTGSGIKITTFIILLATIKAALYSSNDVEIKSRRIAKDQIYRATSLFILGLNWIIFCTFCLLITETNTDFFSLFFESISAFATLGLSTGITASLTTIGKILILLSMIIGRIGSFTLILALRSPHKKNSGDYSYPQERVMLG